MPRSCFQIWYGRDEPPERSHRLRAGPLTAMLTGRDLRNVRFGGLEVAQRIYVAVRDRNWGTVPAEAANLSVEQGQDDFVVRLDARHRRDGLDFAWKGEIIGTRDGAISYAMDAVAGSDMTYKLVGLNVHHGMREYIGRPYEAETLDGPIRGTFPILIEPQLIVDRTEVPIFPPVERLTVQLADDVTVRFVFAGDTFEFEDQRNWTDGSFKAQSYPPRRNGFFQLAPGQRVFQKVTLTVSGEAPATDPSAEIVMIDVGDGAGRIPALGLGMASHGEPLSPTEAALLRALRPAHLRADLRLAEPGHEAMLDRAVDDARSLACGLELALFLSDDADAELTALASRLAEIDLPIHRVLVFHDAEMATSERWLALAHERLREAAPGALFAGGTNANFCELNRQRPELAPEDGIVYSINPQIHAFDERSLVENLAPQAETVATARAFGGDRPIVVSPVTFKQRFNAVATAADADPPPGELPPRVDPRQMSLFAAGWTVGSVKYLAQAGAAAVTYFETTGWRGVIETDRGSELPERFPSRPGEVFPVYHVLADLGEWRDGELVAMSSSEPLTVEALAVRVEGDVRLLAANLTADEQRVSIGPLPDGNTPIRRLNADTAPQAMTEPERFRASWNTAVVTGGALTLTLLPFEVVRVDIAAARSSVDGHPGSWVAVMNPASVASYCIPIYAPNVDTAYSFIDFMLGPEAQAVAMDERG